MLDYATMPAEVERRGMLGPKLLALLDRTAILIWQWIAPRERLLEEVACLIVSEEKGFVSSARKGSISCIDAEQQFSYEK